MHLSHSMKNYSRSNSLSRAAATILFFALALQLIAPLAVFADEVDAGGDTSVSNETSVNNEAETSEEEPAEEVTEPEEPAEEEIAPTEEEPTEPETTAVVTGDATAGGESESEVNTNIIDTTSAADDEADEEGSDDERASTTTAVVEGGGGGSSSEEETELEITDPTNITIDNAGTSTTDGTTTATTGENTAGGAGTGDAFIATGDAVAYVDVLNVVNTNIVNSDGLVDFINETLGYGNIDLRDAFLDIFSPETAESTSPCSLNLCDDGTTSYSVTSNNFAEIVNNITVGASTGGNRAEGINATITTGDAYASANVINVANTNVIDSNYLLLVFNNFSDYTGSLILPNSDFFASLLNGAPGGHSNVTNNNTADVSSNVGITADSGANTAEGAAAAIATGDSYATGNVTNLLNQNFVNTGSFSMLIRVHGDWSGEIFGLPDGMSWEMTGDGIRIYSTGLGGGTGGNDGAIVNTNNAVIRNNVQVYALTGDNHVDADADGFIQTGNAVADANILNMANTNIIGSNWSSLIFNIYGNWNGNIAFGQPDLWLGVRAETESGKVRPGSGITYTYTIFNRGDATARDVRLENRFFAPSLDFTNDPDSVGSDHLTWSLGDIPAGGTKEFSYNAVVNADTQSGDLTLIARAYGHQPDANDADNEDTVVVNVVRSGSGGSGNWTKPTASADFTILKEANKRKAEPGESVDYTVTFKNKGGRLYDAVLVDILENEDGDIIHEEFWELGEIPKGEMITVDYTIEIPEDMELGVYRNRAQLIGLHGNESSKYREPYESPVATHELGVGIQLPGEVLGECAPYLTTYMRYGSVNDPSEVAKLQKFLNAYSETSLDESGFFDKSTEVAVRAFQMLHADEVLHPWGMTRDSGYVYYTTQNKINKLVCGESGNFTLTPAQQAEILAYRTLHNSFAEHRPEPVLPDDTLLPLVGLDNAAPKPEEVVVAPQPELPPLLDAEPPAPPKNLLSSIAERIGNWLSSLTPEHLITMR